MKSEQILSATEKIVSALLGLRWCRVSNTRSGSRESFIRNTQRFEFYKADGALACTVEFEHTEIDEGPLLGYIWGRSGKIFDNGGAVIVGEGYLTDSRAKPHKHPLNDLHDMIWNKESGEPVSPEGKFPESMKLEKFIEELGA